MTLQRRGAIAAEALDYARDADGETVAFPWVARRAGDGYSVTNGLTGAIINVPAVAAEALYTLMVTE